MLADPTIFRAFLVALIIAPTLSNRPAQAADARAQVPKTVASTGNHGFSVTPVAGVASTWLARFSPSPGIVADLFAEAPNGYYFDTARGDGFRLILAQKPADAKGHVPVTFTLVDGLEAYQSTIRLDVAPATP